MPLDCKAERSEIQTLRQLRVLLEQQVAELKLELEGAQKTAAAKGKP